MDKYIYSQEVRKQLIALVRQAGRAILDIYKAGEGAAGIQIKEDESPLTAADLAAHQILVSGLPHILDVPIISEEGELPDYAEREHWPRYWLIDPLDGTKEFIERNGEFTVNIALIEQGAPVLGVVHVPVEDVTYLGSNPRGDAEKIAQKYAGDSRPEFIKVRPLQVEVQGALTILTSHRHGTDTTEKLLQHIRRRWLGDVVITSAGSSLKFCLLAEGVADFYPRLAPTSEWDTAAAQAVLEAAGGAVIEAEAFGRGKRQPLRYNTGPSVINPFFYALGDSRFEWKILLQD